MLLKGSQIETVDLNVDTSFYAIPYPPRNIASKRQKSQVSVAALGVLNPYLYSICGVLCSVQYFPDFPEQFHRLDRLHNQLNAALCNTTVFNEICCIAA